MSHNISPSLSNASPTPNLSDLTDFTALASSLNEVAQALLKYGERSEIEKFSQKEQTEQTKHINQAKQAGQREQAAESSLREQSIKFCYDTNGERTSAFSEIYADIIRGYRLGEFHDEIRCFHICASNVRKEYELLDKYNCMDLNEFLHKTYAELSIIIKLIGYLDKEIDLSAAELHQVCRNLFDSLDKLQELHRHMENLQLVHKAIIPA